VPSLLSKQTGVLVNVAVSLFYSALAMVTIVIVTMYLPVDQERIKTFFVGMFPEDRRVGVLRILAELRRQIGGYVRGQIISSVLAATFAGLILFTLGIPHYLTLAAFVFLADFVPMFGQTIGTIPPVLVALTISPVKVVIVLVLFILYQQLENHTIVPRVYANTLKISPLVALVALLLGAKLLGILGMVTRYRSSPLCRSFLISQACTFGLATER
jgi:predicted PurR-regulated permease PerM